MPATPIDDAAMFHALMDVYPTDLGSSRHQQPRVFLERRSCKPQKTPFLDRASFKAADMSPVNAPCDCAVKHSKIAKAKSAIRALLGRKPCPLFSDPSQYQVHHDASSSQNDNSREQCQLDRYLRGGRPVDGEEEVLTNRVYSMLVLEDSSVLEYLALERCDPDDLPPDIRRGIERVIKAQVQSL
ncbi:hypothetical protein NUW58_g5676 [Xylaria curta]|uniref:Uncharacterized protein n=1 Tax=Xylaria curta TaxID=42375 RepID=A0ACC1P357_9PEZI|nr:hypothetical protein NUW58_g5676 [Xylaria curta]